MTEQHGDSTCEHQAAQQSACWHKPDYEIVETSLEVTAYYSGLKS
jgi:coenzyme PQQ precursor peptide PqqA